MKPYKKRPWAVFTLILLVLLLAPLGAGGQKEKPGPDPAFSGASVFMETAPMNARVVLDGIPQLALTPLLVRDLPPGNYKAEFRKEGWTTEVVDFEIPENQGVLIVKKTLSKPYFQIGFPGEESVNLDGHSLDSNKENISLPEGTYSLERNGGILSMDIQYPREANYKGVQSALYASLAFLGLSVIDRITDSEDEFTVSPLMGISATASAILGYFTLRHKTIRNRFYTENGNRERVTVSNDTTPDEHSKTAEEALSLGRLDEAAGIYTVLIQKYPDSDLLPQALYNLSRINLINGNIPLAAAGLERLEKEYPVSEFYDRICHTLANLYYKEKEYGKSLKYLDAMVYADPFFNPEEIESLRNEILGEMNGEATSQGEATSPGGDL